MRSFFLHMKFWMPLALLLIGAIILEILLKFGIWDDFVKPRSFLGNNIYRHKAIEDFGLEKIDWITIGDSKFDWGIIHEKIFDLQKERGLNHLRMSFESSYFMSIQATIDWSINNMPNLKGIMIGLTEDGFGHYSNMHNGYKIAWRFKDFINYGKYKYFHKISKINSFWFRSALYVYFKDIKDFIGNVKTRLKQIKEYKNKKHKNIFKPHFKRLKNYCAYNIDTLEQCIQTSEDIKKIHGNNYKGLEKFIVTQCGSQQTKNRYEHNLPFLSLSRNRKQELLNNWKNLFISILNRDIELKLVLLPESSMFDYAIKPINAVEILQEVIAESEKFPNFKLLDLRKVLRKQDSRVCEYYSDPLHFSDKGKSLVTKYILENIEPQLKDKEHQASVSERPDNMSAINFEN